MPGVNKPSALLNCARPRMVPVARSMTLSTKSIRPACEKSVSSSSFKLPARQVRLREDDIRFCRLKIGACLIESVLERPLVDGEQEVALFDDLPVAEMNMIEVARHSRAHFDHIDRHEATDVFVLINDGAFDRVGDSHLGRRSRCLLLTLAAAREQAR